MGEIRTRQSNRKIPFIEEYIDFFSDKSDVFAELELKTSNIELYPQERLETFCHRIVAAVVALPPGSYCFTSFDQRTLETMKRLYPDQPTGLIVGGAPVRVATGVRGQPRESAGSHGSPRDSTGSHGSPRGAPKKHNHLVVTQSD